MVSSRKMAFGLRVLFGTACCRTCFVLSKYIFPTGFLLACCMRQECITSHYVTEWMQISLHMKEILVRSIAGM